MSPVQKQNVEIWDAIYANPDYAPVAPYTDVVAFLARKFAKNGRKKNLLEIGCGVGQNLAYARWVMGFEIYGIDYSARVIELAKTFMATRGLEADLQVGDVQNLPYEDNFFHACIERAVIQHNEFSKVRNIVGELHRVLRPGGLLCCSFASEGHVLFGNGKNLGNGDFFDPDHDGIRHFFARRDVDEVFSNFEIERLKLATNQNMLSGKTEEQYWVVELRKK
jgi:SAM-dependent methyltransferase